MMNVINRKISLAFFMVITAMTVQMNAIAAEPESSTSANEADVITVITSDIDNTQPDDNRSDAEENEEGDGSFTPTVQISEDLSVSFPVNI